MQILPYLTTQGLEKRKKLDLLMDSCLLSTGRSTAMITKVRISLTQVWIYKVTFTQVSASESHFQ